MSFRLLKYCFVTYFVLNFSCFVVNAQEEDPGEPLFLTPLIQSGEIATAMEAAKVKDLYSNITSYSGFITVNEEYNSNMFFWFFPAAENSENAPVILWNDGGPGIAAAFSIFGQNGPFSGQGTNISLNPYSWHFKYNMIYMDNPVEVGFSFTEHENGYILSGEESARDIYQFLLQFFQLFPHLQGNQFYNGGASYGATYAINAAYYIHQQKPGNPTVNINLTGIIIDSPWIDPHSQAVYGDSLYNAGLINEVNRDYFNEKQNEIRTLLDQGSYLDAFTVWKQITQLDAVNITGFSALYSIYNDVVPFTDVTAFLEQNSTRKGLHVGTRNFNLYNLEQSGRMQPNFMKSAKPQLDILLKEGYKMLIYVGNMDILTGHIGVNKLIQSLTWEGANDLASGTRSIWKVKDKIAGYVTSSQNASVVYIRNAGHGCLGDQPERVLDAVEKFTEGSFL